MRSIVDLLEWIAGTAPAIFVMESSWAFPLTESIHVIAIALVVGLIAIIDLRLLGLASSKVSLTRLIAEILPWTWGAFVVAVLSGLVMFVSQPAGYFNNTAFRLKVLLLVMAGCNMLIFHFVTCRDVAGWGNGPSTPAAAKLAGGASLTFWVAIVVLGRQIGFTMTE